MSCLRWALIGIILTTWVSGVQSGTTAFPVIPKHLLECYMDNGIYHRANRLPSSFELFLDLIRKIEASPTSRNINARELSMVLLHYLKLDGIQYIPSSSKPLNSHILPFGPSGDQYFKHRLTLIGLVPRIDETYMRAINESLTLKEMCNLHFMLSYSIDPYKRSDERCSPLFHQTRSSPESRSRWPPRQIQNRHSRNRPRYKRSIHNDRHVRSHRVIKPNNQLKFLRKREIEELQRILKRRTMEGLKRGSRPLTKREIIRHEKDYKQLQQLLRRKRGTSNDKEQQPSDVEVFLPEMVKGGSTKTENGQFTIGNQELLSHGEDYPKRGVQSIYQSQPFGRHGGRMYPQPAATGMDETGYSYVPGIPLSDCPVVNGIITTQYGSLAIGTVVTGIAAGLNPEMIPPSKLSVDPSELETPYDRVNNTWATTLAGTVADALSSPGLFDIDKLQISKGGWNETIDPKWYLLENNEFTHLTEVLIRGSLDGLYLGSVVKEWSGKYSNLKLSQILETYYGGYWGGIGANNRVALRPVYAPDETFRKQLYLMSLVLKKQKTNYATVLDYGLITREAVSIVTRFIETMDEPGRSNIGTVQSGSIDSSVNLMAVIDSSWEYSTLKIMFDTLRRAGLAATPMQSTLSIMCGYNGVILTQVTNSADFHTNFTKDTLLENCTRGMNLPAVFRGLEVYYRKLLYEEKQSNKMNTDAQVTVLFFYDTPLEETRNDGKDRSKFFRDTFPGVRLIVASNGHTEGFLEFVKDPKDVVQIFSIMADPNLKSVKALAEAIGQSYQRISNPSCGSYFNDDGRTGDTRVTDDIKSGYIAYYRIIPQYFYTQKGDMIISIRSKNRAPLTICHSRDSERPAGHSPRGSDNPDPGYGPDPNYLPDHPANNFFGRQWEENPNGPVQCKQITSEVYKIEYHDPCGGFELHNCPPLYISVSAPMQDSLTTLCANCRLPTNTEFEISTTGLSCYNSAAAIFVSPLLLSLIFFLSLPSDRKLF